MKKFLALLLASVLSIACLAACGEEKAEPTPTPEPEPEEPEPEKSSHLGLMAFLLLGTATAIGAFIYLKKTKDTKKPADDYDPDADYDESEENYLDSLPDDLDDDFETMNDEEVE